MAWHDANISKFVKAWKDFVDPAGAGAAGVAGTQPPALAQGPAVLDYALPK
jgi:hypothetical protein